MNRAGTISAVTGASWIFIRFCAAVLFAFAALPAFAANCSDAPYNGVIDGNSVPPPSQIQIDGNCTIRNFPASNPMNTNFSFFTQPGQQNERWLIVFDNVVHTGNMSCNAVHGHRIWFTNGSSTKIKENCQNLLIPVEKIDKLNPQGQTTVTVGVPFTYRLIIPVLFDPATDTVINTEGSPNTLHSAIVWDDLNATGVDLTYLGHTAYWLDNNEPVPHTFTNVGGLLTFNDIPIINALRQFVIEITVVLEDSPANTVGTQFINVAKWEFGRLIDDVFYQPLPGEWGVTPPLTIAAPELVVTKDGPDLLGGLNLGEWGEFTIDVLNAGNSPAWSVSVLDRLPGDGSSQVAGVGGMCEMTPELMDIQIREADGITWRPLADGTYSMSYTGPPTCELSFSLHETAGPIGPGERLVIRYRTKLDPHSENGAVLTNVVGTMQWFNDGAANAGRQSYGCPLSDGTVGIDDCQDAHSVMVVLSGYFYEKTVQNLTTGQNPASIARPGDTLRYTLRLQTTEDGLDNFTFYDELDAMNDPAAFAPGTLSIVGPMPPGAVNNSDANGGAKGTGVVDIGNMSLPPWSELRIQFDVQVAFDVPDGMLATNQSQLLVNGTPFTVSDDPNVNGQADPAVVGDEDPTHVLIFVPMPDPLAKASTQATATIGETFSYRITVPSQPHTDPIYDVRILDDLSASAADLRFVSVERISGPGSWTPVNTGTNTNLVIRDPGNGIDIPAGEQIEIEITVVLENTPANVAGLVFTNTASYTFNRANGNTGSQDSGGPGTSAPMTIIEPELTLEKDGPSVMQLGSPDSFTLDVHNVGDARAWGVTVTDRLPHTAAGGMCEAPPSAFTARVYAADGTTPVSPPLTNGADFSVSFAGAPNCTFTLTVLSAAASIGPQERLIIGYQAVLDANTSADASLTNVAGATGWSSLSPSLPSTDARTYVRALTDGTVGVLDHEDAHTVIAQVPPESLLKAITQDTATIGEPFSYRITVPAVPHAAPLYDVRIVDDLSTSAANLRFVAVTKISGTGSWTPVNTGTATNVVIEDPVVGIDIPAGEQIEIEITVALEDSPTNVAGLTFTNTAAYTFNAFDGDDASQLPGHPVTSPPMTIVEPELTLEKSGPEQMRMGTPGTFMLNVHNAGGARAWGVTIVDRLPNPAVGGMCDSSPTDIAARVFAADGVTPVSPPLVQGDDFTAVFAGDPTCTVTLTLLTPSASIGPDQRLVVTYQASLDAGSEQNALLTNVAGATAWHGADPGDPQSDTARSYTRTLTDGTVGVLDHEDAHTVFVHLAVLRFEKTVANVSRGQDPGTLATPGETLRYTLRVENVGEAELVAFSIRDELDALNAQPAFRSGTLNVIAVPPGADASQSSATGGAQGTGVLDVRNLSIGGLGDSLEIQFEIELARVIGNTTLVLNQAQLISAGVVVGRSDDPNVNGPADPFVSGDEDPTRIQIESAPAFRVEKISSYVTGDPDVLLAGETLRYAITIRNIGTDHAYDAVLRDEIPANTTYLPGSTTLNGAPVADQPGNTSPLSDGVLLHAPGSATPGFLPADPDGGIVATVGFDVVVNVDVIDGTVISNQGFVSAPGGSVFDQPSDDPRTDVPDDPTRDVVGNLPLLYAEKTVALLVDEGSPDIVDPGDVLRYTITIHNHGNIPATAVVLRDDVPENTTYVADTLTLNGTAVGQPDGGVSPLVAGIAVSSPDLTPPLPMPGDGTISPGQSAVIQFDVRVDDGVPAGTLIVNQGLVTSAELPNLLTDGDGNPATGPQPTVVVVGDSQVLLISKDVAIVGGGPALAGSTLEYVVRVTNVAMVPATGVVIVDELDLPVPGQLSLVDGSARLDGSAAGITVAGSTVTADYAQVNGALAAGRATVLRFRAVIDAGLAIGTTVTNIAEVRWNTPEQTATASVSVDVGGVPGVGIVGGSVWHDVNFDRTLGAGERALEGWIVELYRNGRPVHTTTTDASGHYQIAGMAPNDTSGDTYDVVFRAPGAGSNSASLGAANSPFTDGPQSIRDIVVVSGGNLQTLNLPIDPNGVVYNSILRTPVAGATLSLARAGSEAPLPSVCFDDPAQQNQVTPADGWYKFDLNFSEPACPSGESYVIRVTAPPVGFVDGYSAIIPPATDASTAPFGVPGCPGGSDDAVPETGDHCEVQVSASAPAASVRARTAGTRYHAHLTFDASSVPGSSQIFNNHIALDPELDDAVAISKTTPMVNVSRGQLVPYVITVRNVYGVVLNDLVVVDRFPAGFHYVEGSARLDGVPTEPVINGRELMWSGLDLGTTDAQTITLLLGVGAGVSEGEYVNRAQVIHLSGNAVSGEATATVRVVPDPTFDCTDVTGKVFDDANRNGIQDAGERGLPGVRLVTARGLTATTDEYGRFHITCAIVPREGRGSNFVLKLDDRTLPSGFRATGNATQVQRATRGKALRFSFGASIHRVVALDVADAVFEPGTTVMREHWQPRIGLLLNELDKAPAILRIAYLADVENPRLVERRLEALKAAIVEAWKAQDERYALTVETETFWRRGAPPERIRGR